MPKKLYRIKFLFYIFLFTLNYSCNGQDKSENKNEELSALSAVQKYQKQEHQFEFQSYKMVYNGEVVKLGSIADAVKIFGTPTFQSHNFIYHNNPIFFFTSIYPEKDKNGKELFEYKGKKYPFSDEKGIIEQNSILYRNGGKDLYLKDKNGILKGDVTTYRLWMSPYETMSIVPNKSDSAKTKIPALNGYIKINGQLIHHSITKKELVEKLKPMPKGGQIVGLLGDPVLIYDLGDKAKDFEPNMNPDDPRVFIDIVFKIDPKTKEEKGIYYINYYYNLKDKD